MLLLSTRTHVHMPLHVHATYMSLYMRARAHVACKVFVQNMHAYVHLHMYHMPHVHERAKAGYYLKYTPARDAEPHLQRSAPTYIHHSRYLRSRQWICTIHPSRPVSSRTYVRMHACTHAWETCLMCHGLTGAVMRTCNALSSSCTLTCRFVESSVVERSVGSKSSSTGRSLAAARCHSSTPFGRKSRSLTGRAGRIELGGPARTAAHSFQTKVAFKGVTAQASPGQHLPKLDAHCL